MNLVVSTALLLFVGATSSLAGLDYIGVNLSGAEFGSVVTDPGALPGTYNTNYTYPSQSDVDYFQSNGMNTIRLPFRWERLQHTNGGPFDVAELGRLDSFVSAATGKGMFVVLDAHNFGRYYPDISTPASMQSGNIGIIGSAQVPNSDFANFLMRLATIYKTNKNVIFCLMNEPNHIPATQWVASANVAIAAIRNAGATNLIMVPGTAWTGAWSWNSNVDVTANSIAMLNIVDPGSNFCFEVHQYLDGDSSGNTTNITSETAGRDRLMDFTSWLKGHGRKGFLGEFAVANSTIGTNSGQIGGAALTNMLKYVTTNSDVWIGWAWWSAGPWWGEYRFTLEPNANGDRPTMTILKTLIPIPAPLITVNSNKFLFPTQKGFVYQHQFTTNLSSIWVSDPPFNGTGTNAVLNLAVGSSTKGFHRVKVDHAP